MESSCQMAEEIVTPEEDEYDLCGATDVSVVAAGSEVSDSGDENVRSALEDVPVSDVSDVKVTSGFQPSLSSESSLVEIGLSAVKATQGAEESDLASSPEELSSLLEGLTAKERISWALERYGEGLVLTTSFGIQSAVILHMVTELKPDIKVVWVDTGYFPAETYEYMEELRTRLNLNLSIYQSDMPPAHMEALHGELWNSDDVEDIKLYNRIRKVEPLERAFKELCAKAWITGIRRTQTEFRKSLKHYEPSKGRAKLMPLLEWSSRDVAKYLKEHNLPKHPLEAEGYTTVGDWHSSRALTLNDLCERDTRFNGLIQECGIHTE
ncbi:hypothetical protein NDN08_005527 [Rhodosorus marinus]|uniref:Phosphoadenosine phosphosulphate reductase domain-containing protein n=1 Tax=Rhodosorus marinus TaxID=101924 RepID=A0AAV8V1T7_9RHOD|nr:hypothetical protein NDN08_005527 [Rhodosorus marinus]